jgi:hypothetical protein
VSKTNLRAVLAADMELGAGNMLRGLAEHGADMDMPRVTFLMCERVLTGTGCPDA